MPDSPPDDEHGPLEEVSDELEEVETSISSAYKILGEDAISDGAGVLGHNTATGIRALGVEGVTESSDTDSAGLRAEAAGDFGETYGVDAVTQSSNSNAAAVRARAPNGGRGVRAVADNQIGVFSTSVSSYGVSAVSSSSFGARFATDNGPAAGFGRNQSSSGTDRHGLRGLTDSPGTDSAGVFGRATEGSGVTYGVQGVTQSVDAGAAGVRGEAIGTGGTETYGVYGSSGSSAGYGLYAAGDSRTDGNHEVTGTATVNGYVQADRGFRGNVGASVFLSSDQTIAHNTNTRIEFDSEVADDRNEFDTTAHEFTCAEPGDYQVQLQVQWMDKLSGQTTMYIRVFAGSNLRIFQLYNIPGPSTETQWSCKNIGKVIKGLTVGDNIYASVEQDEGVSRDLDGGSPVNTYMTVTQVG